MYLSELKELEHVHVQGGAVVAVQTLHQERRHEQDTELDFKNYRLKYEESQQHIRKLEAEQDTIRRQFEELKRMVLQKAVAEIKSKK